MPATSVALPPKLPASGTAWLAVRATPVLINAPEATLTGGEFEYEKVFDFSGRWDRPFFNDREWFIKTNYTYIQSEVSADGTVTIAQGAFGSPQAIVLDANGFVQDGRALQGQSEHLFNAQLGFETFDDDAETDESTRGSEDAEPPRETAKTPSARRVHVAHIAARAKCSCAAAAAVSNTRASTVSGRAPRACGREF